MNPEQTRTTNDLATLNAARNEILDIPTDSMGRLVEARNAYLAAKGTNRSWWRSTFRKSTLPDMEAARQNYEQERNQYAQIEARRLIEQGGVPGAPVNETTADPLFRQRLTEFVTGLMVNEMQNLTAQEIAANQRSIVHRLWGAFSRHPVARAVIGLGLNATMAGAVIHGNAPLFAAAMAGKVALGTVGFEGAFEGLQRGAQRINGDLRNLTPVEVNGPGGGAPGGMNMAEVDRRLAAFQEFRILNRRDNLDPTEQLLWNRKHELLINQVQNELTTANVVNWRRTRREAADRNTDITTAEGHRDAAAAEADRQRQIIEDATILRDRFVQAAKDRETDRSDAEKSRDKADEVMTEANKTLSDDATVGGLRRPGLTPAQVASFQNLLREHVEIDRRIEGYRTATPPQRTLMRSAEARRTQVEVDLAGLVLGAREEEIEEAVDAYRDRWEAANERPNYELARRDAEDARDNAQDEAYNLQTIIDDAADEFADRSRDVAWNNQQRAAAEQARDNARNLTEDQALIVYDILMGGEGRTGVAGRTDIPARANGLLSTDNLNVAEQNRMITERRRRATRWGAAFATSVAVNWAIPAVYDHFSNPGIAEAGGTPTGTDPTIPTPEHGGIPEINLPSEIKLPAGSNPWNEVAKLLKEQLGHDATNAQIMELTKEVSKNSNISVPTWGITEGADHRQLPVGYTLKLGGKAVELVKTFKGA